MDEREITNAVTNVAGIGGGYLLTKAADGLFGKDVIAFFENLKNPSKERMENVSKIAEAAKKKAELQSKETPNGIPLRIAERILNEGSYCGESIMQEYYGGVLLSTQSDLDDEGIFYLATIHRLSSIQLKAHYTLYYVIRSIFEARGSRDEILGGTEPVSRPMPIPGLTYVRADVLLSAIYGQNPVNDSDKISLEDKQSPYQYFIDAIVQGLKKENLVRCFFSATNEDFLGNPDDIYFFFAPTIEGVQLALWGQGYGKKRAGDFLSSEIKFSTLEGFQLVDHEFDQLYGAYIQQSKTIPTFNLQFVLSQVKQKFDR